MTRKLNQPRRRRKGGAFVPSVSSVAFLFLALVCSTSAGFSPTKTLFAAFRRRSFAPLSSAATSTAVDTIVDEAGAIAVTATPPSWEDLASVLDETEKEAEAEAAPEPVLTLYRDTNGWCPFCERVWLCLEVKGLPYRTRLISLQNKPDWYKELVPTSLVPAVLIHDEQQPKDEEDNGEGEVEEKGVKPQRRLVWESIDVMKALDDSFPDTPRLVLDTPEYLEARERTTALSSAGLQYVYAGRNSTLTEEDIAERKRAFEAELDELEESLASRWGPFMLGPDFTGADAEIVPLLERWRYQLPITNGMDISEGRPALQKWFDAMDAFGPYKNRVAGDAYSWAAVSSTFTRYFGGDPEKDPKVKETIDRADAYAEGLAAGFGDVSDEEEGDEGNEGANIAAREAATKLISNHDAVVKDCTNSDPLSQKEVPRSVAEGAEDVADVALRYVASVLLSPKGAIATSKEGPLVEVPEEKRGDAALALRTVARRLCVPRDMGAPAARIMRGTLSIVADRLEEETNDAHGS